MREAISTPTTARTTELIGLTVDGRKVLWDVGQVRPISAFEINEGGWIKSGHYVIDWQGHAITVHCSNYTDGRVGVQFMCGALGSVGLDRAFVEPMLLGVVVPDPVASAQIRANLKRLAKDLQDARDVPHRQRGHV